MYIMVIVFPIKQMEHAGACLARRAVSALNKLFQLTFIVIKN